MPHSLWFAARPYLILPMLVVLLLAGGCSRTPDHQNAIRAHAAQGEINQAQEVLDTLYASRLQTDNGPQIERLNDKHGLLWSLDRGLLAVMAGDYQQAGVLLDTASTLVEQFRSRWASGSIAREAAAAISNDTVRNYDGNAYEHIQVHFWRSLNELMQAQRQAGLLPPAPNADLDAERQHLQNAVSYSRGMVLSQIQETQDAMAGSIFGRRAHYDDPFARLFSAALILALPQSQRLDSADQQFANVMIQRAWQAYHDEQAALAGKKHWFYEVPPREQLQPLVTLLHRISGGYDPEEWPRWASQQQVPAPAPVQLGAAQAARPGQLPSGYGSILLLNHSDLIAHPEKLEIIAAAGTIPHRFTVTRHGREQVRRFSIGGIAFAARGPGADIVNAWAAFPVPPQVTELLAPGGVAVMGTAIPVHAKDEPLGHLPVAEVGNTNVGTVRARLQVLCDLDAYARVTLKEQQPGVLTRALVRSAVKQLAANLAAREAKKQGGGLAGLAVGLAGSALATWSEVADVRGTLLLPNTIQGTLIDVPAGEHQIHLDFGDSYADLGTVVVPEGRLIMVSVRHFSEATTAPE